MMNVNLDIISLLRILCISAFVALSGCSESAKVSFSTTGGNFELDIFDKPSLISGDQNPEFRFRLSQNGQPQSNETISFQCQLNGGGFEACPETYNPNALPAGDYTLDIKVFRDTKEILSDSFSWEVSLGTGAFSITGASGGNDTDSNLYLSNSLNNDLSIEWNAAAGADEYVVHITDITNTTTLCGPETISIANHTFTACALVEGVSYNAHVVAEDLINQTTDASNSPFTFTKDTTAPSLSFTNSPSSPSNSVNANFQFTNSDTTSGLDTLECRLNSASFSNCTSPVNLAALTDGVNTFEVRSTDQAGNTNTITHTWTVNTLNVSGPSYFVSQTSTAFNHNFNASGGSGNYSYSLTVNPNTANVVAGTGTFSMTEGATPLKRDYTLRVTDTTTNLTYDHSFQVDSYEAGVCVWNGSTSTDWGTSSNWSFCSGSVPGGANPIAIGTAPNQPILATSTTVQKIALGAGGGTLTVNPVTLTISSSTDSINSDIKFIGNSTTCTSCRVAITGGDITVINNATLSLGAGASIFSTSTRRFLRIGNGTTAGHLITEKASPSVTEWPRLIGGRSQIIVQGTAGTKSTAHIDGLVITNARDGADAIQFNGNFDILKFDHVSVDPQFNVQSASHIKFLDCTGGQITDSTWSDIIFVDAPIDTATSSNIDMSHASCSGLANISVDGSGRGYGSIFENDDFNQIAWANSLSLDCVWNGSIDSDWFNPGNWSNCNNGRGNYPDQLDSVRIPITANQPSLNQSLTVDKFSQGIGGGTLSIEPGVFLNIHSISESISSDLIIQGATSACTNCSFNVGTDMSIVHGAKLTMKNGIVFNLGGRGIINVGDGVTAGHFAADSNNGNPNEWARIHTTRYNISVHGHNAENSSLDIDGLYMINPTNFTNMFEFVDYFTISKMDNVNIDAFTGGGPVKHYFNIAACNNSNISDTNWSNINFEDLPASDLIDSGNIHISTDASCTGLNNFSVSGTGLGFGSTMETDPNNQITWVNGDSFKCEWTGANSTSWTDPANWNNCNNGRNNYPDHLDEVVIPVVGQYPVTPSDYTIRRFGSGTGGGELTIDSHTLRIYEQNSSVMSDVLINGNSLTCNDCILKSSNVDLSVTNGANLTLGNGLTLDLVARGTLHLGDGTTAGHLSTVADTGNTNDWPLITGFRFNIEILGHVGENSIIQLDGLRLDRLSNEVDNIIFKDFYTINQFDNIILDNFSSSYTHDYIHFERCDNSSFNDTTWDNLNFVDSLNGSHNINLNHATCSAIPLLTISNATGNGAGDAFEGDDHNRMSWP